MRAGLPVPMEQVSFASRYLRLARLSVLASLLLPPMVWAYNIMKPGQKPDALGLGFKLLGILVLFAIAGVACFLYYRRIDRFCEEQSEEQTGFLESLPDKWINPAILVSAAVSLGFQLSLIRWHGTIFELFSIYKNFGLLACFTGLGLGYAQSHRRHIPLLAAAPLFAWQVILLLFCRYNPTDWDAGVLRTVPVLEELAMGMQKTDSLHDYAGAIILLAVTFALTALVFVPIGQVCGALLDRRPKLTAYGLNLLGSIIGVVATMALSIAWTAPAVWFGASFLALLPFLTFNRRATMVGGAAFLVTMGALSWPLNFPWAPTYSPYQIIERGADKFGLTRLLAAGQYFQRIHFLTPALVNAPGNEHLKAIANYYEFPFTVGHHAQDIAIVGSGTGNDVAAALRMGVEHVDAIEIDPAIVQFGKYYHPEEPYKSDRVSVIVNDARTYLRQTPKEYDMVVYGLLDSHTLLSNASNVRLDSFVYTVEAFREARARLKSDGVLSLSFCVLSPELGRKFYLMLKQAFDDIEPVCVEARYDGAIIFLMRKNARLEVPQDAITRAGFQDVTARYADPKLKADLSTDDWPFLYVVHKIFPFSYMVVMGLLVLIAIGMTRSVARVKLEPDHAAFFLLGAGFMLVETRSITTLGLNFGNTWQVVGFVILGILTMAFLANLAVQKLNIPQKALPVAYVLLLSIIGVGMFLSSRGFDSSLTGRLTALVVLTSPLFFSGIIFSTLIRSTQQISGALAANLVGAMLGGLIEYTSMCFGFSFLYWIALALYGGAFLCSFRKGPPAAVVPA